MSLKRANKLRELGEFLLSAGHALEDDGTELDSKELSRLLIEALGDRVRSSGLNKDAILRMAKKLEDAANATRADGENQRIVAHARANDLDAEARSLRYFAGEDV